jgi:hypothetical protein
MTPRALVSRVPAVVAASLLLLHPPLAHAQVAATVQPPVLTRFTINDGAATVLRSAAPLRLSHVVTGRPVEYRVGVRADFANSLWLPFAAPLELRAWQGLVPGGVACDGRADAHELRLYLQVRSDIGGTVQIVNGQRVVVPQKVESNVVSDAICVVPDQD